MITLKEIFSESGGYRAELEVHRSDFGCLCLTTSLWSPSCLSLVYLLEDVIEA